MVNSRDEIGKSVNICYDTEVECLFADGLTPFLDAEQFMETRAGQIATGDAKELIWFVEHPALYTAGTSANSSDLLTPERFPVFKTGRGGEYTYHGPGQRIVYVMLDLTKRGRDVRSFIAALERWIIDSLEAFNVKGERREDRVGVWVQRKDKGIDELTGQFKEEKIAAMGIRLRKWISFHGISINVEPDLEHFGGIVPCGIAQHGVTSLVDLGLPITMTDLDGVLKSRFVEIFGGRLKVVSK